ncbi:MAG: SUMF1/EgtB/PvdO family nonheme iron enzyme [Hyphomonadaceae bacterium]
MAERPKRYRAFLSYSQKDKAAARRLHRALETYRFPHGVEAEGVDGKVRRLGRFFRDDEEMGAATDLGAALQGAIAEAENLVVICSPHAAQSRWVNEEIIQFKRTGGADRIFAVIVHGEPHSARDDKECFPPALRFEVGPDGALTDRPAEPLALDVRRESYERLVVRLAAGLSRTWFDALWKREQRRMLARTTGLSFVTLLAALLVGAATQSFWRPQLDRYLLYTRYAHSMAELTAERPGATFQDCRTGTTDCPVMVVIPEGAFLMGEAPWVSGVDDQGQPQFAPDQRRRISIPRFAVSQHEVTFTDWQACVEGGGCRGAAQPSDSGWGRATRPVINVSWEDAQDYARWLSQMTGHEYRLLTEAEWEYAARGVSSADDPRNGELWSFGNDESLLGEFAWFVSNSKGQTQPVGTKRANQFGLYDMHGNVWEWVQDCYAAYDPARLDGSAVESALPSSDSGGEASCSYRVLRGASWSEGPGNLRSAFRVREDPRLRFSELGFRVARTL